MLTNKGKNLSTSQQHVDVTIVGGGIVGAACAEKLLRSKPHLKVLLLEKENAPAKHQTGRNSGVIHAGVYYAPGSLKAQYCREGLERTIAYCQQYQLPYLQCGKLLVATNDIEMQRMEALFLRCQDNQLAPQMLSKDELKSREPAIKGEGAFLVQQTGIAHYTKITQHLLQQFLDSGGEVRFNEQVGALEESNNNVTITTQHAVYTSNVLLNCAGLYSDQLIKMLIPDIDWMITPFKGEYFQLPKKYNDIVNHLIYPIPDPELPFLGVHLTRMIDGSVTVGPNAVLAAGREAYGKWDFCRSEALDMIRFAGLRKVLMSNVKAGMQELRNSLFKTAYLKPVQKYCPQIQAQDLLPYPAGIRAQAVSADGQLIHDFRFAESARSLHVGNAPSPAATSAMPIADAIYQKLEGKL